jgi:hypothetical protein
MRYCVFHATLLAEGASNRLSDVAGEDLAVDSENVSPGSSITFETEAPASAQPSSLPSRLTTGSGSSGHGSTCTCSVLILPNCALNFPALTMRSHGRWRNVM